MSDYDLEDGKYRATLVDATVGEGVNGPYERWSFQVADGPRTGIYVSGFTGPEGGGGWSRYAKFRGMLEGEDTLPRGHRREPGGYCGMKFVVCVRDANVVWFRPAEVQVADELTEAQVADKHVSGPAPIAGCKIPF